MAKDIPTTEPTIFVASSTWEWDKTFGDYPASDGWELTYYFRSKVAASGDLTAAFDDTVTADGDSFEIRIPYGSTALAAGAYQLVGIVNDGTKQHTVCNLPVQVLPAADTAGAKSHAKTMLDALETLMQSRSSGSEKRKISVNGRTVEYATEEELRQAHAHWKLIVELERNPNQRIQHAVRFTG